MLDLTRPQVSSLQGLPEGAAGIRATLKNMAAAVNAARAVLPIRQLAEQIIADVDSKDYVGELTMIRNWIANNIRYTRDPYGLETLKTPLALLDSPQGDCDDQATLAAALVRAIGFDARFVAIGTQTPDVFDHVYAEAKLGTVWISLETTENVPIGWQPDNIIARMVWHI